MNTGQFIRILFLLFCFTEENEGAGDTESKINIVHAHKLVELNLPKKVALGAIKVYLGRIVNHLKENGKEDRVKPFQQGATEFIKFVMGKYDEMQIF